MTTGRLYRTLSSTAKKSEVSQSSPPTVVSFNLIMDLRSTLTPLFLAATLGGLGSFATESAFCPNPNFTTVESRLQPLADLIAKGEGDYNAVNRGYAGDTPGGIQGLTGLTFENYTVGQVIAYQKRWLYAVGRYQFIPSTLRFAVNHSDVDNLDMFTPETQDKLMAALILYKRPAIGAYLRDNHDLLGWAMDEMAKEWASVEYRNGRGFYDHVGGNRAHISRLELKQVLKEIKEDWHIGL